MADEVVTPGDAPDAGTKPSDEAAAATSEPPVADPTPEGADPAAGDPPATEPSDEPLEWPDDWRERAAKGDEKKLARLKRFAAAENAFDSLFEAEQKIKTGEYKALPENPSEKELAAYRKANGIPEEPTAEAYGLAFPEGMEVTDADKAELGEYAEFFQSENISAEKAQKLMGLFVSKEEAKAQQLYDAAQQKTEDYRVELRSEYGKDYKRNTQIGNNFLAQQLGDKAPELTATTLADGTKLGDHPDFVRFIVNAGLASADDEALATTELSGGQSIADAYREALALVETDPKKYHSKDHQDKLLRLAAAKSKAA